MSVSLTPLPTPHDILPIPAFPYEPNFSLWLVILGICIVAAVIGLFARREAPSFGDAQNLALEELSSLMRKNSFSRDGLAQALKVAKSYFEIVSGSDVSELSPKELQTIQIENEKYKQFLKEIGSIDEIRFRPTLDTSEAKERVAVIVDLVKGLRRG